ncbi:MAG: replication initiation and membrane attachment family protein [Candidatus Coprovivens sp.]
MTMISLLPADTYTVVNKSIITEDDKKNIISLYEPIIGPLAVCLYFTLIRDLSILEIISKDYTHHHLMTMMKSSIDTIRQARESLEGVGLLKSYYKEGEPNSYVYELYSPLSPKEFLSSPIFNVTLYNNVGKTEYEQIKSEYELPKIDLKDYQDITSSLNKTYRSTSINEIIDAKEKNNLNIKLDSNIDFDLLISSLPKGLIKESIFTKKTKELIEQLSFIYDIDTLKMVEIIRTVITEKGTIDKEELRKTTRKYYQYNNNGKLPTLVYRTQPEYLKTPEGDNSPLARITYMFENTTPYDFLKIKNKGANPTSRDLRLLETLLVDLNLQPAVVNVLIDYVLKKNNNKLNQSFVETIAGQWKRCGIETAQEAMELAKKENTKYNKKIDSKKTKTTSNKDEVPVWFNQEIEKEEMTQEELAEMEALLSEFR